jgi:hypothetical protein
MTVNLKRKVGIASASQGGYSARQLPAPKDYGVRFESLIFRPAIDGSTWQAQSSDPTPDLYNLTDTDLATGTFLSANQGSIAYSSTGGPSSGTPKMRVNPLGWRSLGYQGAVVTPGIGLGGITLESWIDFGPHPAVTYGSPKSAEIISAITAEPVGEDNSGFFNAPTPQVPLLSLTGYVYVDIDKDPSYIEVEGRYRTSDGVYAVRKTVLSGNDSDDAGWHHYACEITFDGQITIFFDGTPLTDTSTIGEITPDKIPSGYLGQLDSFMPYVGGASAEYIYPETSNPATRSYIDVAGVRYTKGLRYNGEAFSPPNL